MPVLPPCLVPSTSEYHGLNIPPVANASNVPASNPNNNDNNNVNNNNNNDNINNNNNNINDNHNISNRSSVSNTNDSTKTDTNANSSAENDASNSTSRDGDNNCNTVNGNVINENGNSQPVTAIECNNVLASHESIVTSPISSTNGNVPLSK